MIITTNLAFGEWPTVFGDASGIDPTRLDSAMSTRLRRRWGPMHGFDAFPRTIFRGDRIAVGEIRRNRRRFAIAFDLGAFRYDERDAAKPSVLVFLPLPATVMLAAAGLRLGTLVDTGGAAAPFLSDQTVALAEHPGQLLDRPDPRTRAIAFRRLLSA